MLKLFPEVRASRERKPGSLFGWTIEMSALISAKGFEALWAALGKKQMGLETGNAGLRGVLLGITVPLPEHEACLFQLKEPVVRVVLPLLPGSGSRAGQLAQALSLPGDGATSTETGWDFTLEPIDHGPLTRAYAGEGEWGVWVNT